MTTALEILSLVFVAIQVVALVAAHLAPTGCDPLRNAVSDYGVGRYPGHTRRC